MVARNVFSLQPLSADLHANMAATSPTPTTTYSFAITTFTNALPSTPSSYPTTYTDTTWLPPTTADTECASASAYPSIDGPLGLQAACVISNAADINPNAFWDMYACCPGHDLQSYGYSIRAGEAGSPGICMMQCRIADNATTTWQEVGECLQKRVKEVVCAPRYAERYHNDTDVGSGSAAAQNPTSTPTAGGSGSASAAGSTGAATSLDVVHVGGSKFGLAAFALLALGSAVGMCL